MPSTDHAIGDQGALVPGPPWILGSRGAAREAPENTQSALLRAMDLGLDGVAYDLRACLSGELVLLADAGLERTSDGRGPLAAHSLRELADVDAGGWFGARFAGERLTLFEEALALEGNRSGSHPQHLLHLREHDLVGEVARVLADAGRHLSVRVATPRRDTAIELRDAGLVPLLVSERADDELREFLRRERIAACGLRSRPWPRESREGWPAERWCLDLDGPGELLDACALPINALTTREPQRALAARALARLSLETPPRWPLRCDGLPIGPDLQLGGPGQWAGTWELGATLHNPFGWEVACRVETRVRRGAFETGGLPVSAHLEPGESLELPFTLTGGSFSPGGDPLLVAQLAWERGPGRPGESLSFDVPLERVRALHLLAGALRLPLLDERPGDAPASITVKRRGNQLFLSLENAGGLEDARLLAHLDGLDFEGGAGLRLRLPPDADTRVGGLPFSACVVGRERRGKRTLSRARRWAGGLPPEEDAGVPGRIFLRAEG